MRKIDVVGALCFSQGKLLLTQRPADGGHGGLWEFPGGKVEVGEDDGTALKRELIEELDLKVSVVRPLFTIYHQYPHLSLELRLYYCEAQGDFSLIEADDARYIQSTEIMDFTMTPADRPAQDQLFSGGFEGIEAWPLRVVGTPF